MCKIFMKFLENDFSTKRRAPYIRRKQNEALSMASVKRGVEKIREGENATAIQHFNKALSIFDKNVEALVGRAAACVSLFLLPLVHSLFLPATVSVCLLLNEVPFKFKVRYSLIS